MMKSTYYFVILLLMLCSLTSLQSQSRIIEYFEGNFEDACFEAKMTNSYVMVIPSAELHEEMVVFNRLFQSRGDVIEHIPEFFILLELDVNEARRLPFNKLQEHDDHILIFDSDATLLHRILIGKGRIFNLDKYATQEYSHLFDLTFDLMLTAEDPDTHIVRLEKRFESGDRDPFFLGQLLLARTNSPIPRTENLHSIFLESANSQHYSQNEILKILYHTVQSRDSDAAIEILSHLEQMNNLFSQKEIDEMLKRMAIEPKRFKRYGEGYQKALDFAQMYLAHDEAFISKLKMRIAKQEKDPDGYLESARNYFDHSNLDAPTPPLYESSKYLLSLVMTKEIERAGALELCDKMMARAIKCSPTYRYHKLYAEVLYEMKKFNEAHRLLVRYDQRHSHERNFIASDLIFKIKAAKKAQKSKR